MPQTPRISTFIAELRRRRVFRVAAFYGGIAFVIVQIIDGTFDLMGVPEWVGRIMVVMLALGFPLAMALAWVFDITPEGIVRTEGRSTGKPGTSNRTLIAVTILAVAFGIWGTFKPASRPGQIHSIAVLPLDNLMGDAEQDYLVDGIHDALIRTLSHIEALKVISRTSTLGYRNTTKRMPEIARELGADAIVEGSVLRAGDRVVITAQLIDGRSDEHLWSSSYEGDLDDILALQNEVATAIAEEIKITITPGERTRLAESRKISPEAHEHYLKGLHHWDKRTEEGLDHALEDFQASIDADPSYAPAYAGLALTYDMLGEYAFMPINASHPQAISYAQEALRLDPNLAEAHTALAAARLFYQHDWTAAETGYKKALGLNPGYATAYQWLAELNNFMGRHEDALVYIEKALSIDPLSMIMHTVRANTFVYLERYDDAFAQFEELERLHPGIDPNTTWQVWALIQSVRLDEAVDLDLRILRHYVDSTGIESARLRASYEQGGFDSYTRDYVVAMEQWEYDAVWASSNAWRHALTGNVENTLAAIERSFRDESWFLLYLNVAPDFDFVRAEPRFQAVIREIGLAP